jgi:diaminopimelate epimerase
MPGGDLAIEIAEDFGVRMTGPVVRVAEGEIFPECLRDVE